MVRRVLSGLFLAASVVVANAAPEPAPDKRALTILDAANRVQKLKSWKITAGTRNLSWLAPAPPAGDEDNKSKARRPVRVGPEALEFREEDSTTFVEGVVTFIPMERLRSLVYDPEEKNVTAHVAAGPKPEDDAVLTGTTRFDRVNKIAVEAEVDNGDSGIADVRFVGGTQRGIRGLRFDSAVAGPAANGRPAVVTTTGKVPATHKVTDLQAVYRLSNGYERLSPLLMFKKTFKIDVTKIRRIQVSEPDESETSWQLQTKDGGDQTLTLLRVIQLDGQDAQIEGLVGKVPAGYKLFPVLTIGDVVFDATDAPTEEKNEK